MPESVTDRPTKSHEHIFLLSKSKKYYYDADAIREKAIEGTDLGLLRGKNAGGPGAEKIAWHAQTIKDRQDAGIDSKLANPSGTRNKRDVWTVDDVEPIIEEIYERRETLDADEFKAWLRAKLITINSLKGDVWKVATHSFKKAHFATFPPKLIEPCILAGCPSGSVVLDPFAGAGTTGLASSRLGRSFIGIELNEEYCEMARRRIYDDAPLFNDTL